MLGLVLEIISVSVIFTLMMLAIDKYPFRKTIELTEEILEDTLFVTYSEHGITYTWTNDVPEYLLINDTLATFIEWDIYFKTGKGIKGITKKYYVYRAYNDTYKEFKRQLVKKKHYKNV